MENVKKMPLQQCSVPNMLRTAETRPRRIRFSVLLALFAAVALLAGCSSDDTEGGNDASENAAGTTDNSAVSDGEDDTPVLRILVSNDDGYDAEGIDILVTTLAALPNVEVIVAAPATQQSGTGGSTTDGELVSEEATTASGHPAYKVEGFPADSINWALDGNVQFEPNQHDSDDTDLSRPHVVIAGINHGQNVGRLADQISGTVGAARAAASQGIPALATSLGINMQDGYSPTEDYQAAADFIAEWVTKHRESLLDGSAASAPVLLENFNYPACIEGESRGVVEVDIVDQSDQGFIEQDCLSTLEQPVGDIEAFNNGFATISTLPLEPFTTVE